MNILEELGIHTESLITATAEDPKFFAPVIQYLRRLHGQLTPATSNTKPDEITFLCRQLEEFWSRYRPEPGSRYPYIAPSQTSTTDGTIRKMQALAERLQQMSCEEFMGSS